MRLPFMQLESDLLAHGAPQVGALAGCSPIQALGHIAYLRAWAVAQATDEAPPDGWARGPDAADAIEAAACWGGEPGRLLRALKVAKIVVVTPEGVQVQGMEPYRKYWRSRGAEAAPIPEPELTLRDPYHVRVRLLAPEERAAKAQSTMTMEQVREHIAEQRARIRGKPHVYFIQQGDSGAIKIGCSKNPTQRLQGLQTGHSEPLRLLTCAVGSQAQERALHDRFAHLRVSGEWFRPAEDLLAYIRLVNDRRAL